MINKTVMYTSLCFIKKIEKFIKNHSKRHIQSELEMCPQDTDPPLNALTMF